MKKSRIKEPTTSVSLTETQLEYLMNAMSVSGYAENITQVEGCKLVAKLKKAWKRL